MYLCKKMILCMLLCVLSACHDAPKESTEQQTYLKQQAQKQGYPTLIAMPAIADYALPFCEKKYCIDIDVFSFSSQDAWFNHYTDQQIAALIRRQLGLSHRLSLQGAVDAFIIQSDQWQQENNAQKPWSMYINPRIAMQQGAFALLIINTEYQLGDKKIPEQNYFFVVDRKMQKTIRLYDIIKENQRISLMNEIQKHFYTWQQQLNKAQKDRLPEKLFWANQDWFFDEQGIAIYYRAHDFDLVDVDDLTIYLSSEQIHAWLKDEYIQQLNLN